MSEQKPELDIKLKKVLWACNKYWQTIADTLEEKVICYTWILKVYQDQFNETFHQSLLQELAKLGYIKKVDTSRSNRRCYYKITNPQKPSSILNL